MWRNCSEWHACYRVRERATSRFPQQCTAGPNMVTRRGDWKGGCLQSGPVEDVIEGWGAGCCDRDHLAGNGVCDASVLCCEGLRGLRMDRLQIVVCGMQNLSHMSL